MTLINERDTEETYYSSFANFEAQGETGNPTFVEAKDDIGTWMSAIPSIVLPPKSSKIVQVKITVPKDADAGGHFGAIFWGTTPNKTTSESVSIGAKTGMLVLLTVNGNVSEKGGVLEFATKNSQTYYTSLPIDFYYRFQNNGSDRIKPSGNVVIKDMIGLTATRVDGNPVTGNILPKSVRRFETSWYGADGNKTDIYTNSFFDNVKKEWRNFAFGHYKAHLQLTYGTKKETTDTVFSFWVFPWQLLLVSLFVIALSFFILRAILRHYNTWVINRAKKLIEQESEHKTEAVQETHAKKHTRAQKKNPANEDK